MKLNKSFKGFTLVEVLIVIIIVGILIAALLPRLQGTQARARDTARQGHINQVGQAVALYSADNGGTLATGDVVAPTWSGSSYLSSVPTDPQGANGQQQEANGHYAVYSDGSRAVAVAALENGNGNCDSSDFASAPGADIIMPGITPGSGDYYCVIVE